MAIVQIPPQPEATEPTLDGRRLRKEVSRGFGGRAALRDPSRDSVDRSAVGRALAQAFVERLRHDGHRLAGCGRAGGSESCLAVALARQAMEHSLDLRAQIEPTDACGGVIGAGPALAAALRPWTESYTVRNDVQGRHEASSGSVSECVGPAARAVEDVLHCEGQPGQKAREPYDSPPERRAAAR